MILFLRVFFLSVDVQWSVEIGEILDFSAMVPGFSVALVLTRPHASIISSTRLEKVNASENRFCLSDVAAKNKRGQDLMATCHEARKGRNAGSRGPKPVATKVSSTIYTPP
jgi:hypothetical protein